MTNNNQAVNAIHQRVNAAATLLDADIFAYFGDITEGGAVDLCDQLEKIPTRRKNALLILATLGGDRVRVKEIPMQNRDRASDRMMEAVRERQLQQARPLEERPPRKKEAPIPKSKVETSSSWQREAPA